MPLHRLSEHPEIGACRSRCNAQMSLIGRSVKRLEDRPLLTGSGRFAADIAVPDMLYMRVVRSPVAFGRLTGLGIAEALRIPAPSPSGPRKTPPKFPQSAFA